MTEPTHPPRPDGYPLLANKQYAEPSLFQPPNLLREARRQKGLPAVPVPRVVLLDPDGDVVRHLRAHLADQLTDAFSGLAEPVLVGRSWTTDAPYRETRTAIAAAEAEGIGCVEMEAAALYAYAARSGHDVVCLAHITNTMATEGDDFEKGTDNGVHDALAVVRAVAIALGGPAPPPAR